MEGIMRVLSVGILSCLLSGCGLLSDGVVIYGTPEGIRAYHDGVVGIVAQAKTARPNGNTAYWEQRNQQTQRLSVWEMLSKGLIASREEAKDGQ
jgi:hypothetical protein